MKLRRPRTPLCLRRLFRRYAGTGTFFALWPRRCDDGTWIWLGKVERYRKRKA